MLNSGLFLYLLGMVFIFLFWSRVRGLTFEQLLQRSEHEHECVKKIFKKHPHGGSWNEFKQWWKEHK